MSKYFFYGRKIGAVPNLKSYLEIEVPSCVDFIVSPLFKEVEQDGFQSKRMRQGTGAFYKLYYKDIESSVLVDVKLWTNKIVGQLSSCIHLDDLDEKIAHKSERDFAEEIEWSYYLGEPSVLCPELNPNGNSNYAAIVGEFLEKKYNAPYWIPVDIQYPDSTENFTASWKTWSTFHSQLDFCGGVQPCVRLTSCHPTAEVFALWKAEPVDTLILPTSLFIWNDDQHVSLPSYYEEFLLWFKYQKTFRIILEGPLENECQQTQILFNYLLHLYQESSPLDCFEQQIFSFNEVIQIPLQPLMDNLQSSTYDVFEKDHVKYQLYEQAIYEELLKYHRVHRDNIAYYLPDGTLLLSGSHMKGNPIQQDCQIEDRIIITLVGAGRGPLILASLHAAKRANCKILIYAIEKNPNAIITLQSLSQSLHWGNQVMIVETDMRIYKPSYYSDIILSELLGSFGDNELSVECLYGTQRFLHQDGIYIPRNCTSHLACCMSTRIYNNIKRVNPLFTQIPLESSYVVKIHNGTLLSEILPVFTFNHPDTRNGDFQCTKILEFIAKMDGLIHGFSGYFDSDLSEHVKLSIVPQTHSTNLVSWFPFFFPITQPFYVNKGSKIVLKIWRRSDQKRVWYEWAVLAPIVTKIHNINGKAQWIGL